jgi:hypothetical protein
MITIAKKEMVINLAIISMGIMTKPMTAMNQHTMGEIPLAEIQGAAEEIKW